MATYHQLCSIDHVTFPAHSIGHVSLFGLLNGSLLLLSSQRLLLLICLCFVRIKQVICCLDFFKQMETFFFNSPQRFWKLGPKCIFTATIANKAATKTIVSICGEKKLNSKIVKVYGQSVFGKNCSLIIIKAPIFYQRK